MVRRSTIANSALRRFSVLLNRKARLEGKHMPVNCWGRSPGNATRHLPLATVPAIAAVLRHSQSIHSEESLAGNGAQLYGRSCGHRSPTGTIAACPFKFFVHSGLRAEERKLFELDVKSKELSNMMLALFHEQLSQDKRCTISHRRTRLIASCRGSGDASDGLLHASDQSKFMLRVMIESLQILLRRSWAGCGGNICSTGGGGNAIRRARRDRLGDRSGQPAAPCLAGTDRPN